MSLNEKGLTLLAYHEAGHAVAAWSFQHAVKFVTIQPTNNGHAGNTMMNQPPRWIEQTVQDRGIMEIMDMRGRARNWIRQRIIIGFAGAEAEKRFSGSDISLFDSVDISNATELAEFVVSSEASRDAYLSWLRCEANDLVQEAIWWNAIECLAHELRQQKRISGKKFRSIITDSIRLKKPRGRPKGSTTKKKGKDTEGKG